jgi:Cu-processing system permease protein
MSRMLHIAAREIRIGFRNPWAYSFMALFALFALTLWLIHAQGYVGGYSGLTGTLLTLVLYLLPLVTLTLGSFSLTGDKEDGSWELLSTYPVSTCSYIVGKYAGTVAVQLVIVAFGFGLAGTAGWIAVGGFDLPTFTLLIGFAASLSLTFLAVAMLIGALARNRWQALTMAVAVWFFAIIAWPSVMISILGFLPYPWIKPAVSAMTFVNPAELSRLFAVVKLGGGSVLGPEYYGWVKWIRGLSGTVGFAAVSLAWIGGAVGAAVWLWERGRKRA